MVDTLGEARVRVKFNPSANQLVDVIKQDTAKLINIVNSLSQEKGCGNETFRLIALALTAYEEAAMWAVKAATALPSYDDGAAPR
jgi:hypothetical protein